MENNVNPGIRDEQGRFKPGFSGNPSGRPKDTLKQYVAKKLQEMSIEEREEFLKDIPKDLQWRMSEGNPKQDTELSGKDGEPINVNIVNYDNNNPAPPVHTPSLPDSPTPSPSERS